MPLAVQKTGQGGNIDDLALSNEAVVASLIEVDGIEGDPAGELGPDFLKKSVHSAVKQVPYRPEMQYHDGVLGKKL